MSVVLLALTLCACSGKEALGLVISLECETADETWKLEMTRQGVVELVGDEAQKDESSGGLMFVFEAVGEGETELDFYCVKSGSSDISLAVRVKKYSVSVNSEFAITSRLISDEEITAPAAKKLSRKEAEELISEKLGVVDGSDGNEQVIKYKESFTEDGTKWYKFILSEVVTRKDGKTVLRYMKTYAVSENGEIKTLKEDSEVEDTELNIK